MREEDIRKRELFDRYLTLINEDIDYFFNEKIHFEHIPCIACGGGYHDKAFDKSGFSYVECRDCGSLFVNPRPRFNQLMSFYQASKSGNYWSQVFMPEVIEARREKMFRPRAEMVANIVKNYKSKIVADIGAGLGTFLEELQSQVEEDVRLVAIEPSIEQADQCRKIGIKTLCMALEDLEVEYENSFDLMTNFELVEHLHEPKLFFEKIHTLLKDQGILVFTTLNYGGFDLQILKDKSKSISPPHHLNFFNIESISQLLEDCAYKIIEITTPGELDWDIVEGMYKKDKIELDSLWKYLADHRDENCKRDLQEWIKKYNLSSHMRIVCQKI